MQSVTKSVTSLVMGIAVDQGEIPSVNGKALAWFPEYPVISNPDTRKNDITLKQRYLWWLLPLDNRAGGDWDTDIITASGAKGQWLFIVPRYDIVVAATSSSAGFTGFLDPVEVVYNYVLPAVEG